MADTPTRPALEFALLGLLALFWGSSYLFIKVAVAEIPPVSLIAFRVSLAALVLLVVMLAQKASLPRDSATWGQLLVQSFLNSFGAWTLLAWGQQHVDSGLAGVLNSTSPIFVFLISFFFLNGQKPGVLKFASALLGLLGVILIIGTDVLAGLGQNVTAQLAVLAGAVLYALAAINGRRFSHLPPVVTATAAMLWASVILVPASLIVDEPWRLTPSLTAIFAAIALSVFCTGLALLIYFRLVNTLGSMGVASQAYLRSGVSVVLGMIFLGEQLTAEIAIGIAATIIGVALINLPPRKPV